MKMCDGFDLDNLPEGVAVDYVYCEPGKPNRLVYGTLPFQYRHLAFAKADVIRLTHSGPFAVPILYSMLPVVAFDHCCFESHRAT